MHLSNLRLTILTALITAQFTPAPAQTPVYFNIISHNESSDPLDYDGQEADYNAIRPLVKALCDTIIAKEAKYNLMVDANFIQGVLNWEDGADNPDDLLEWAASSPFIDVDAHNHFLPKPGPANNPFNYTDLVHLLDSCGVALHHHVLGGVTYADTVAGNVTLEENWTPWADPVPGYAFPWVSWQADIVWGTASPGHVADYTHFGVWKPAGAASPSQFGTHDPDAHITHIGGGCKEDVSYILVNGQLSHTTAEVVENIQRIVSDIQKLPTTDQDFYTLNMLVNFRDIPEIPHFTDSIARIIDGIQPDVEAGRIIWATLGDKYDLWTTQHPDPNDFFNVDCTEITTVVEETTMGHEFLVFPNPTTGLSRIQLDTPYSGLITIRIVNAFGQPAEAWHGEWLPGQSSLDLDLGGLPSGLYQAILTDGQNQMIVPVVKYGM